MRIAARAWILREACRAALAGGNAREAHHRAAAAERQQHTASGTALLVLAEWLRASEAGRVATR